MKNPFDHKTVEKLLFAHYAPRGKDRRTRTFLRKMARHISHAYEIGYREGLAGKEPAGEKAVMDSVQGSQLVREMSRRAYMTYRTGFNVGAHAQKEG